MKFTKMHGLGNDYVCVNVFEEHVENPPVLAHAVSDRHTGIGSDGLILIGRSEAADVRMTVYNSDGSRARMCGNGIRCVAKYAVERGLTPGPEVRIDTDAGMKVAECHVVDGVVRSVRVDMSRPALAASEIPSTIPVDRIIDHPFHLRQSYPQASACAELHTEYVITCVSMGNPHAVVFVDDLVSIDLDNIGPNFEHAPEFPEGVNTHFVRVDSPRHVTMRTWERGSGATRACGTGACAVCVAGSVTKRTRRKITATLPGGDLDLEWADNDHVYMTGPAVEVFTGNWHG